MKSKLQNSIKFLKRFFEPAFLGKSISTKILIDAILKSTVQIIIPVVFLPKGISLVLEKNYTEAIDFLLILLVSYTFISLIRSFFMLPWQYGAAFAYQKLLYKKYLPDIIKTDNLVFERLGTGKVLSSFNVGTESLARVSSDFLSIFPPLLVLVMVGFLSLKNQPFQVGILFLAISLGYYLIIALNYYKQTLIRKTGIPIFFKIQSKTTKSIMSKFEILQANMIQKEKTDIDSNFTKYCAIENRAITNAIPTHILWYTPTVVLISILLGQSYDFLNLNTETIAKLTIFASAFADGLDRFFKILTGLLKEYPRIQAFWEMVDEPKIVGYDEGKEFVHRGGEIEFKGVNFTYENR